MFKIMKKQGKFVLISQNIATNKVADERVKPLLEAFVAAMNDEGEYHPSGAIAEIKAWNVFIKINDDLLIEAVVRRKREPWLPDKIHMEIVPGKGYSAYALNHDLFKENYYAVFDPDSVFYHTSYDDKCGHILHYRISVIDLAYYAFGHNGCYLKHLV